MRSKSAAGWLAGCRPVAVARNIQRLHRPRTGLAAHNARQHGFAQFATRLIDWNNPPAILRTYPGADVLYETRCLADVLNVLDAMLAAGGEAGLSDPAGRGRCFPNRARK